MSFDTDKLLAMLAIAERALAGATAMRKIIEREAEVASDPEGALANILVMAKPEFVIEGYAEAMTTVALVRAYYSKTRLGINRRAREKRKRAKRRAEGRANDNDGSVE